MYNNNVTVTALKLAYLNHMTNSESRVADLIRLPKGHKDWFC